MNEDFAGRIRSAAIAGWWTILIGSLFLTFQWLASLALLSIKPGWLLTLWGPDITWETVRTIWLWAMAIFKICLWLITLVVIWLSLWARRLSRRA
jgi:hypothetical protein